MKEQGAFFELVGGLGNQLFIFTASRYLSEKLGVQASTFWGPGKKKQPQHSSNILSFDAPELQPASSGIALGIILKVRQGLRRALSQIGLAADLAERFARLHTSSSVGKDSGLSKVKPGWLVTGYFQTSEYFEWLNNHTQTFPLRLKNPSSWYLNMEQQIIKESPTVIHVRRGDYLADANKRIGALAEEYYLSGLHATIDQNSKGEPRIWIFSDDPTLVKSEFKQLSALNVRWVAPPENSDPAESLLLMSKGEAIVISNSTFSWWAAALGRHRKVVAPSQWFRAMPEPDGLVMKHWIRAPSTWL